MASEESKQRVNSADLFDGDEEQKLKEDQITNDVNEPGCSFMEYDSMGRSVKRNRADDGEVWCIVENKKQRNQVETEISITANALFFPEEDCRPAYYYLPVTPELLPCPSNIYLASAVENEGGLPDVLGHHDGEPSANLNISDVFEAISLADPSFDAGGPLVEEAMARAPPPPQGGPFVRIVEQPASKALRFRYECEGRSAGSIPGVTSTADRKTYPTIEIVGHTGKAIVVVSCVTREEPYKPHPHNLVGRDRCSKGVCTQKIDVTPDNNMVTFSNLGIQCVKRRDVAEALRVREELRVDPFRTGYAHRNQPQSIDLNAVRLCFQVFVPDEAGRVRLTLPPVVSDVIYDKKAMSDLQILRLSSSAGSVNGGTEIILLCEKVTREDISVVMYEERRLEGAGGGGATCVVWEEPATVVMVHKQYAIAFTTPAYRDPAISTHAEVFIQLKRPTDGARSVGVPFTYIPEYQDMDYLKRKRQKTLHSTLIQKIEHETSAWQAEQKPIKAEPSDKSPLHMGAYQLEQRWGPAGGAGAAAAEGAGGYYEQWPHYHQPQHHMQVPAMSAAPRSPLHNLPATSPNVHVMSPNIQVVSPHHQIMSPQQQVMSPQHQQVMSPQHQQVMSPQHQVMSPQHQVMSPQHQVMSPQHQVMSPHHGHMSVSPGLQSVSPQHMLDEQRGHGQANLMQQQLPPMPQLQQAMETNSSPSLSRLLEQAAGEEGMPQLNSADLSGLSALLGPARAPDLSDSLTRLSTADLFPDARAHL